jgi:putative salt-induced outer membrane protein YdiY
MQMTLVPACGNRVRNSIAAILLLAGALLATPTVAESWQPDPPAPDEFDWVQLTSGEWVKGQLEAMYDGSLDFDSDHFGLIEIDWEDVAQIRSSKVLSVRTKGNDAVVGRLALEDGKAVVLGETRTELAREDLLTITSGAPRERNYWNGTITLGANIRQGNTDQVDGSTIVSVQRRTIENRVLLDYVGNYSMTDDVETANNHRANGTWDRFVSERVFLRPVFAEYFRDTFQNVAHRGTIGTGIGYQIIDTPKTGWRVVTGPAYQYTRFDAVQPGGSDDEGTWAWSAGTTYDTELTDWIDFTYDWRLQFTNRVSGRYNHHMIAGFDIDLLHGIDLNLSMVWDRIEEPQPDAAGMVPKKDDFRLIFGLGYDF